MFKITPVGSCRITTPMRLAQARYGFVMNRSGVYGFCHSSAEAVQMVRYFRGEIEFPADIVHVIARSPEAVDAAVPAAAHTRSDVYVVELSSAKIVTIGDFHVQQNYLNSAYLDFFSNPGRAKDFWDAVDAGDQAGIDAVLLAKWSGSAEQQEACALLRRLRRRLVTYEELFHDMLYLQEKLGDVLFVTHVNALTLAGETIPSRADFIGMVERVASELGVAVYNPTAAMNAFGQIHAIEDYSDSLAHFTEDFSNVVFDDWYSGFLASRVDRLAIKADREKIHQVLCPHFEALAEQGRDFALVDRLRHIVDANPDAAELRLILADILFAMADTEKASSELDALAISVDPDNLPRYLNRRFELAIKLRRFDEVKSCFLEMAKIGRALPAAKFCAAADLLRSEGDWRRSFDFHVIALQECSNLSASAAAITRTARDHGLVPSEHLDAVGMARLRKLLDTDLALELAYIENDAEAAISERLNPLGMPADVMAALLVIVDRHRGRSAAAKFAARWRDCNNVALLGEAGFVTLMDKWFAEAVAKVDSAAALNGVLHVLTAQPLHKDARIYLRTQTIDLRERMRHLYRDQDFARLQELTEIVALIPALIHEHQSLRMRLAYQKEDYRCALDLSRAVVAADPESISAWLIQMRSAKLLDDPIPQAFAARRILQMGDGEPGKLLDEAILNVDRAQKRALQLARDEGDMIRAIDLYRLAASSDELKDRARPHLERLEASLSAQVRSLELAPEQEFSDIAQKALVRMPDDAKIRLSVARNCERRGQFAEALEHWTRLTELFPLENLYSERRTRCHKRLGSA
ncbi:MAG: hypothetical protein ACK5IP_06305 [Paracoccus sp. (in: a-proteobacteria)]